MKSVKFEILNQPWTVRVLGKNTFERKYGTSVAGHTSPRFSTISLIRSKRGYRDVLVHELVHAYLDALCMGSISLTGAQMEEVLAELLAKHGITLLDKARHLEIVLQGGKHADL